MLYVCVYSLFFIVIRSYRTKQFSSGRSRILLKRVFYFFLGPSCMSSMESFLLFHWLVMLKRKRYSFFSILPAILNPNHQGIKKSSTDINIINSFKIFILQFFLPRTVLLFYCHTSGLLGIFNQSMKKINLFI